MEFGLEIRLSLQILHLVSLSLPMYKEVTEIVSKQTNMIKSLTDDNVLLLKNYHLK